MQDKNNFHDPGKKKKKDFKFYVVTSWNIPFYS